jgi:hypothetical protein
MTRVIYGGHIRPAQRVYRAPGENGPLVIRIQQRKRKRKRSSRPGGLLEQMVHQAVVTSIKTAGDYLRRHERSNRRKRSGWLVDLPNNVYASMMRGKSRFWDWSTHL